MKSDSCATALSPCDRIARQYHLAERGFPEVNGPPTRANPAMAPATTPSDSHLHGQTNGASMRADSAHPPTKLAQTRALIRTDAGSVLQCSVSRR